MKIPEMPSAVVSAMFFVVVFLAEMVFGRETVAELFRRAPVLASLVATVAAWLLRLWQEYQRIREGSVYAMSRGVGHATSRDAGTASLWRRWLWG